MSTYFLVWSYRVKLPWKTDHGVYMQGDACHGARTNTPWSSQESLRFQYLPQLLAGSVFDILGS